MNTTASKSREKPPLTLSFRDNNFFFTFKHRGDPDGPFLYYSSEELRAQIGADTVSPKALGL